jgi:hypothetical protein
VAAISLLSMTRKNVNNIRENKVQEKYFTFFPHFLDNFVELLDEWSLVPPTCVKEFQWWGKGVEIGGCEKMGVT